MQAKKVYKALLHCYPAAFRHEYGNQMLLMFGEQLGEAERTGSWLGQAMLWAGVAADALTIAPREHAHVIARDLRYALRMMVAQPAVSAVAIVSLALGIGANTAIFSLWNGVLHASLPAVQHADQLVMLTNPDESGSWTGRLSGIRPWLTFGEFEQLRDHAPQFSSLMASQSGLSDWQIHYQGSGWEKAYGRLVSGGFFDVLGVHPAIGRLFTTEEDAGEPPYAVISYSYWQRRFGGAFDVIGRTITIRAAVLTIVGVAPYGFVGETVGQQPDFWLPLRMQPAVLPGRGWLHDTPPSKAMWLHVFGRLKPGVTLGAAESAANTLFQAGLQSFYGPGAIERRPVLLDQRIHVQPAPRGASATRGEFSRSLTALLAAVGVLLLIACANLANLLLARGAARRHEIALRLSLGANRERLVRQLVTESLLLATIGAVAAGAVAYVLHGVLVHMLAASDPRFSMTFTMNPTVLAFIVAATIAATLVFGVLPAWQVTNTDTSAGLKDHGRGALASFGELRMGRFLVCVQLALSLPLLVGAGLLVRTVHNLQRADLGYPANNLLLARVDLKEAARLGASRADLQRDLLDRIRQLPGVQAVSISELGLFSGGDSTATVDVEGFEGKSEDDRGSALDFVGPGYFSTLGIPIILGRDISEDDRGDSPKVCAINEAFGRRFFARRNPIGLRIGFRDEDQLMSCQIVGVARDAHTSTLRGSVEPRYFLAARQKPSFPASPTLLVRTATEPTAMAGTIRKVIQVVNPALPIMSAGSLEDQLAPLTAQDRATAQLVVVFGGVALALAAVGLYGVLSCGVARRTGEIAIRLALGARPARVVSMILGETSGVVGAGLLLGGGLAYGAARLIDSRLYGIAPQDPLTLALATGLLLCVAFSAAYLPARRASRLDPMAALRHE